MTAIANTSLPRAVDLITGQSLRDATEVIDLGSVPVPGLFFSSAEAARAAVARVRLVRSRASGLLQLDRDINPAMYTNYKSGAATAAHFGFLESLAKIFSQRYPRTARILEIGGNAGLFMRTLRTHGFRNLYVVDPSSENLDNDDYTVIRGLFPEAVAEKTPGFDVVIGQHVLEHSHDPVSVLRSVRNILSPGGEVWVEVPDIAESALADDGMWLSIIYALHSAYFDAETLKLACAYGGLQVISMKRVNHYGKSLLAVCRPSTKSEIPLREGGQAGNSGIDDAIKKYFSYLAQLGSSVPSGAICWGAAERCIAVLAGCMKGGFSPGAIIDSNEDLHGLYVSGMAAPVLSPTAISGPLPAVFVLSPTNAAAIMAAHRHLFSTTTMVYVPSSR